MTREQSTLFSGVSAGNRATIAKAITECEVGAFRSKELLPLLDRLWQSAGNAEVLGVTGPPGVGKSTLINKIADHLIGAGRRVGVISVDPILESSGGSLLGDRLRMEDASRHEKEFFMRSMSTRGEKGGVALAVAPALLVLDAAGIDTIVVETVGVGQNETDLQHLADVTLLVQQPETGDWAQSVKGGVVEVADILCINKVSEKDANKVQSAYSGLYNPQRIMTTEANTGRGIQELVARTQAINPNINSILKKQRMQRTLTWWTQRSITNHIMETMKDSFVHKGLETYTRPSDLLNTTYQEMLVTPGSRAIEG